ncbi:tetratricopeptide repeat protein [Candidatus Poribacteria bacterium]|nr:tetratricopeptide repeat protein [Candidatus Poribacteria bacterium]
MNLPKSNYVSRFTFHASRFQQRLVLMLAISCGVFPAAIGIADEMGVDYYDPINVLKFADALYGDGDYLRAAGEYQRYLFYKPQDADHILYRIAVSYRLGGRAGRALQFLEKILGEYPQSDFTSLARYEIGYSYFLMRAYDQSLRFLNETQDLIRDENYRWKSRQLIGLNYLMLKRWEDAGRLFNQFDLETVPLDLQETVPLYRKYAQAGKRLPSKSPILAGLFSAIVPGTGKLYARQTGDALFTVLVLALTGWQAYDGFHRNGTASTKGWVFGTLSGFFYLGNVYGSVVAAQVHNRRVEEEFLATIPTEIP